MIKAIFTFFQVQIESVVRHAVELLQTAFGIRPEAFDAVDVNIADGKKIVRMIDSQMLAVTDIDQSVVAAPAIGMNHRIQRNASANNGLQRFLLHIRDDLRVNLPVAFVNAEDNLFAAGSATAFAAHATSAEVRFIDFNFARSERRRTFAFIGNALSDFQINFFDALMCQITKLSSFVSGQIKRKILGNLPCFSLANFSIPIISV